MRASCSSAAASSASKDRQACRADEIEARQIRDRFWDVGREVGEEENEQARFGWIGFGMSGKSWGGGEMNSRSGGWFDSGVRAVRQTYARPT